jgi:agmatinase
VSDDPEVLYDTFLGLPPELASYEASRVVLLRAPYDHTSSYGASARLGPAAIMAASAQVELFDLELGREIGAVGVHALPALAPSARGPEEMVARIEAAAARPVADGKLLFTLGGEHTVTLGAARAVAARHPGLGFLVVDAHLDLRDSYEGSRFSHACVSRRLLELGRVVHVGARVACPEELEAVRAHGLDPIWGWDAARLPEADWIARALGQLGEDVYVSVDVDGLDPAVFPATGTPVPGGLAWYPTLALLRAVGKKHRVVGCDLCELAPIPHQLASDFAAASLACKMIGYFAPP